MDTCTPKSGQGVPKDKTHHWEWNPGGEKNQSHVGGNPVEEPLLVSMQDWRDVMGEEEDTGTIPNPNKTMVFRASLPVVLRALLCKDMVRASEWPGVKSRLC